MFAKLKSDDNCFISTILGCVAMLVYKTTSVLVMKEGKPSTKTKLGILNYPYRLIKNLGPSTIGVEGLPGRLFEKDFVYPSIDEENIAEKLTQTKTSVTASEKTGWSTSLTQEKKLK